MPEPLRSRSFPGSMGRRRASLAVLGCLALGLTALGSELAVPKEYQLKAAFLFNFTKFVDWPAHRFTDPRRPITIGVLGGNPFGSELVKIVQGQRVNGRGIAVANVATAAEAGEVDLLFVSRVEESRFATIAGSLRGANVLIVGESTPLLEHGAMIVFTIIDDRVRFEINQTAAEAAGLRIRAQLLKLAIHVRRKP